MATKYLPQTCRNFANLFCVCVYVFLTSILFLTQNSSYPFHHCHCCQKQWCDSSIRKFEVILPVVLQCELFPFQCVLHIVQYSYRKVRIIFVAYSKSHEGSTLPIKSGIRGNHPDINDVFLSGFNHSSEHVPQYFLNFNNVTRCSYLSLSASVTLHKLFS